MGRIESLVASFQFFANFYNNKDFISFVWNFCKKDFPDQNFKQFEDIFISTFGWTFGAPGGLSQVGVLAWLEEKIPVFLQILNEIPVRFLEKEDLEKEKHIAGFLAGVSLNSKTLEYELHISVDFFNNERVPSYFLMFTLLHELMHLYWDHPIQMLYRKDSKDRFILNIAQDILINQILFTFLSGFGPLLNPDFKNSPLILSTWDRDSSPQVRMKDCLYNPNHLLPTLVLDLGIQNPIKDLRWKEFKVVGMPQAFAFDVYNQHPISSPVDGTRSKLCALNLFDMKDQGFALTGLGKSLLHLYRWQTMSIYRWLVQNLILPEVKESTSGISEDSEFDKLDSLTEEEKQQIVSKWEQLKSKIEDEVKADLEPGKHMDSYNSKTVQVPLLDLHSFAFLSKKLISGFKSSSKLSYGINNPIVSTLPGRFKAKKPKIGICFDTSASIDKKQRDSFLSYAADLIDRYEVHMVFNDTNMRGDVVRIKRPSQFKEVDWKGGGGTDLNPGLTFLFERGKTMNYQFYICFTDGIFPSLNKELCAPNLFFVIPKNTPVSSSLKNTGCSVFYC